MHLDEEFLNEYAPFAGVASHDDAEFMLYFGMAPSL